MVRLGFVVAIALLSAVPIIARADPRPQPGPEKGIASTYSHSFVGHRTASGERLDSTHMTAAHRSLPFGTVIEVTNKRNGRKVVVTVNDRGPHKKGRVIDLSPAAASMLGMNLAGIVPVELRIASAR